MTPRLLAAAVLVVLTAACTGDSDPSPADPTAPGPTTTATPATPTATQPAPSDTRPDAPCWSSGPSKRGSGFVVELNIMSGNPNPSWRLTPAEADDLRALLRDSTAELDLDGPDELGGYGVIADRAATRRFMAALDLPEWVWVQGDGPVARFLAGTGPCPRIQS